ncbi:pentapeptide repeat-containing protein [Prosthecochloris vibrioformis]|uniref:Pentapeptide repeat-containing protein n=1 Tax=Prosthecochloris vibrioformis TaxID=1098 RepID=A0A5C4RZF3_PROVB|nr:pentapeptide repeat-containing protein [Prosthecochloris vibrioformis]TNJ36077.1 hypothetical protein FGF68_08545 [Prosthecochloris vibrioformis]
MKLFTKAILLVAAFPLVSMASDDAQLLMLREGRVSWNAMRDEASVLVPDFSDARLRGMDLAGFDLSRADLSGADCENCNLADCDLDGAKLDGADFFQATLVDAVLRRASLQGANLEETLLSGADLEGADLRGATLRQADLSGASLRGADLRDSDMRRVNLRGADLEGADLRGAYLWRSDVSYASFRNARVASHTVLETGRFATVEWAGKHGAVFDAEAGIVAREAAMEATEGSVMQDEPADANVVRQKIRYGQPVAEAPELAYDLFQYRLLRKNVSDWNRMRRENTGVKVRLSGAELNHKVLDDVNLVRADLQGVEFKGGDLVGADLRGANLSGANLREADLSDADLGDADLRGAYLWRANLSWARLVGAVVNSETIVETGRPASVEWAEKYGAKYSAE